MVKESNRSVLQSGVTMDSINSTVGEMYYNGTIWAGDNNLLIENSSVSQDSDLVNSLWSCLILVVLLYCCTRSNVPSQEHWRGSEIRRRAQEVQRRLALSQRRETMKEEERRWQISKFILSKVSTKREHRWELSVFVLL